MNIPEGFIADLRRSTRSLLRRPAFFATAVVTLAIGIGATTAMFSVTWGVALKPLPFEHHERLFTICTRASTISPDACVLSPPNAEDLKRRVPGIEFLGLGRRWDAKLRLGDEVESVPTAVLTPDVFRALGVRAQRGRLLQDGDLIGRPGIVAVISDEFWRTRLGDDTAEVIGRTLSLDGEAVTIVGVLQPAIDIPRLQGVSVWRPLHIDPRDEQNRNWAGFHAFGRTRDGYTQQRIAAEIASATATLRREHFASVEQWDLNVLSLSDMVLGRSRRLLLVFLAAVGLLLLVACANVANLLLEQASARRREWGVRTALGASPERIMSLQLTESFLLAFVGALGGLGIAVAGVRALRHFAPPGLPRIETVSVDATVLAFTIGLSALTAVLFGVSPAIRAAAVDLAELLKAGGRTSTTVRTRLSATLVTTQIAIAMTLVVGATLLSRHFQRMASWSPGFAPERLVTFSVSASRDRYGDRERIIALWSAIEDELRAVPGVEAAASASAGPLFGGGDGAMDVTVDGGERPRPAYWFNVGPGFFQAMGIGVVRGREIDASDDAAHPGVVVVNETFVRRYLGRAEPVGRQVTIDAATAPLRIVGVVRDVPPFTPGAAVDPQFYFSMRQEPRGFVYMVVRTASAADAIAPAIRQALRRVDPELVPYNYQTIRDIERDELRRPLFNALLLGMFALTAVLLAGVGTYALLAYHVQRRVREMGIRLALGARPAEVSAMVVRDGLVLALPGILLGLLGGLVAGKTLASVAPGLPPNDPAALTLSAVAIAAIAVTACIVPARRAASVAPASTLQSEE